ncbi:phenoloxidase-activating enzyme-like [Choristoneura fumiferana]|uniref:phenoloxidase-activating enzyme-like n=1 Tax=Choristoneura fumiferana TaxID=7141 RepID=UPI003D15452C
MSFMWECLKISFFDMELWLSVIVTAFLVFSVHADTCTTPNGKPGQCQPIQECGFLWDLAMKSELTITKYEVNLLRKSACGFDGAIPKVCCPDIWDVRKCELTSVPPDPRSRCCGVSYSNDLVKNGKMKEIEIFPWVGRVEFQREIKGKFRNAVLISSRYAVSVAQCFTLSFTKQFGRPTVVRFKAHKSPDCVDDGSGVNCHEGTFSIGIENVLSHKDYNEKEKLNDIALIRFAEDAPYTDYIRPICIPTVDITATGKKDITIITAGWGPVDGKVEDPVMRNFYAPYLESKVCAAISSNITNTTISLGDNQICAIVRERYHCRMDFGEPLVYYNENYAEFLGIGSYPLCKGSPDVYTKVYNYRSWILNNTKK